MLGFFLEWWSLFLRRNIKNIKIKKPSTQHATKTNHASSTLPTERSKAGTNSFNLIIWSARTGKSCWTFVGTCVTLICIVTEKAMRSFQIKIIPNKWKAGQRTLRIPCVQKSQRVKINENKNLRILYRALLPCQMFIFTKFCPKITFNPYIHENHGGRRKAP